MTAEAEINDLSFDEAVANRELEARAAQDALMLPKLKLEHLWDYREELGREIKRLSESKGRADFEIRRRLQEAQPAFFEEGAEGGVSLAGETLSIGVTWKRTWDFNGDIAAGELLALVDKKGPDGQPPVITQAEYGELVSFPPTVNGTAFNKLMKRGGRLAEVLGRMRSLKSASLVFTPKARQ